MVTMEVLNCSVEHNQTSPDAFCKNPVPHLLLSPAAHRSKGKIFLHVALWLLHLYKLFPVLSLNWGMIFHPGCLELRAQRNLYFTSKASVLNPRSLRKQKDVETSLKGMHSPEVLWCDMTSYTGWDWLKQQCSYWFLYSLAEGTSCKHQEWLLNCRPYFV